jgi:hypothetical protein
MSSASPSSRRRVRELLKLRKPAGVFFFVVGACLVTPFAVYAGAAAGSAASTWVSGTLTGTLGPLAFLMALLAAAGAIILISGLAWGVCGCALLGATRYSIGVLRGRPPHAARPTSGV